jgi:hypoxanthine phosphoribosyltransferase
MIQSSPFLERIDTPRGQLVEYLSPSDIREMVSKLGHDISAFYDNKEFVMIGILRGCLPFIIDLSRELYGCFPHIDYMGISSYDDNKSSGEAVLYMEPKISLDDKDILLVDTIIGSGLSMRLAEDVLCYKYHPRSISTCCLINNITISNFKTTFKGFGLEKNHFLVGYGLDLDNDYRHLRSIFELHQ